jgi:predicted O-methyltransferase YrrM
MVPFVRNTNGSAPTINPSGMKKKRTIPCLLLAILFFVAVKIIMQRPTLPKYVPSSAADGDSISATIPEVSPPVVEAAKTPKNNDEKTPLYLITPSSRPSLLSKGIFHVLPLHQCFDVQWIIVHNAPDERIAKAPFFRNVFPWITEIFTFNGQSISGNHERNIGIEKVLTLANHGLVYFLDDDNILPADICQVQKGLSLEKMYYADQRHCGNQRLTMDWLKGTVNCTQGECASVDYVMKVDSGTFLTPVELLKKHSIQWRLDAYTADGIFFSDVVNAVLQDDGNGHRLEQLPSSVHFNYNELNDANGCAQWRVPWSEDQLHESLQLYRNLVSEMQVARESFASEDKMDRTEVSFHNYVHILHVLRPLVTAPTATYVEIGVWKGGTSIFMSRHPLHTDVIGIDGFFFSGQREEAEQFRKHLQGKGDIHWFKSDSKLAIPDLKQQLNGKEIDILFIDGDHSVEGTRKDFELYSPLVAKGGFVVFDDFLDTSYSGGVRVAIMDLIRDGEISLEKYDIMGSVQNIMGAGPVFVDDQFFYDWQSVSSNEYVIRKRLP